MLRNKRKADEISNVPILIDEIINLLIEKNIFVKKQIDLEKQDIIINLLDKNNNVIGEINGGVGEFKIIENGKDLEKNAFSINWVSVRDNYKGYNLGIFLIIYIIYLCKVNFSDIDYIVLDDDTDEIIQEQNIYVKLGFIYQETKIIQLKDGRLTPAANGPEMQLNINNFFNNMLLERLYKIKNKIRNLVKYEGGKRKRKTKRNITKSNKVKSNKVKSNKNKKNYRKTKRQQNKFN